MGKCYIGMGHIPGSVSESAPFFKKTSTYSAPHSVSSVPEAQDFWLISWGPVNEGAPFVPTVSVNQVRSPVFEETEP